MTESFPRRSARTQRFTLGTPRSFRVSDDGRRVTFLRAAAGDDPRTGLWVLDLDDKATSGTERLVVDPRQLRGDDVDLPAAERARRERLREAAAGITAYDIDADARRAAFAVNGELTVADVDTGALSFPPAQPGAYDPRLNPGGTHVAYVVDDVLRCTGPDGDVEVAADADPDIAWGVAEFAAAEEMGRTRGHWWSPDGTRLAATRVDNRPVATWYLADPTEPAAAPRTIRYPAAGTANAIVDLAVFDLAGDRVDVDWAGSEFEYLATVAWRDDRTLTLTVVARDQRTAAIVDADVTNGVARLTERRRITDRHWVELVPGTPAWAGDRLVTVEADHHNDTQRLHLDGTPLSPVGLQVAEVVTVADDGVVVGATGEPTERHIVHVGFDGTVTPLTTAPGVHRATGGATTTVLQTASLETVGTATTVSGPGGVTVEVRSLAADPGLRARPHMLRLGPSELRAALFTPHDHDGITPLPVVMDPYGGPHAQRVTAAHNAHLASQWLADQGFAVVVVDGRGTPARGPSWERAVHGDLAAPVLDDQVTALHAAAEVHPYLDLTRVGVRGWSFGGYLAALAVLRRPDVFAAAVAGAPVTDWRLYDTYYTERYLGHPDTDPDNYRRSDLVADAADLRRPLLLIHGLADDNVVAAHTLQLSRALLSAGRPHEVLPLSGISHMTPQEVVAENLLVLQVEFLHRCLASTDAGGSSP